MLVLVRVFFTNKHFFMQHLGPNCTTGDLCNITRHGSQMIYGFFCPCTTGNEIDKRRRNQDSTIEIGDDPSTSQQKQKLISSSQWFPKDLAALHKTRPLADFHRWSTEKSWCMKCWSKPVLSDTDPFHTSRALWSSALPSTIRKWLGGLIIINCGDFEEQKTLWGKERRNLGGNLISEVSFLYAPWWWSLFTYLHWKNNLKP